jgi:sensor histidine kinase YesM
LDSFVPPQIVFQDSSNNIYIKYVSSVNKKAIKDEGKRYLLNIVSALFYPLIFLLGLSFDGIKQGLSYMWGFSSVVILLSLLILGVKARHTYKEINRLNEKMNFFIQSENKK